jgi:hypothetical protein
MVANRASASYLQLAQLVKGELQRAPPGPSKTSARLPPATA